MINEKKFVLKIVHFIVLISMLFYEPININVYDLDRCIDHIKVEKRKIH